MICLYESIKEARRKKLKEVHEKIVSHTQDASSLTVVIDSVG
jgi:hypothetical protein